MQLQIDFRVGARQDRSSENDNKLRTPDPR